MLCYQDKTFCGSDCQNQSCPRYFSDAAEAHAKTMKLAVSMADMSRDCQEYRPGREKKK